jgi:hypothetical protein
MFASVLELIVHSTHMQGYKSRRDATGASAGIAEPGTGLEDVKRDQTTVIRAKVKGTSANNPSPLLFTD